jgi:hypothetical protein
MRGGDILGFAAVVGKIIELRELHGRRSYHGGVAVRETFRKARQRTRLKNSAAEGAKRIARVLGKRIDCLSVRLRMNFWSTFLPSLARSPWAATQKRRRWRLPI